ncbi:MAG: beta-glucosidase BglX [Saprospiraceae bacterium]
MRNLLTSLFLLLLFNSLAAQSRQKPINERVDSVLALMTLDEKIGQMTLFTTDWGSTGPTIRPGYREDIRQGRCGALFNAHGVTFTRELQRIAVEESRLKIPLLFGYDVIHGYKTIFPIPLAEAASWDMEAVKVSAEVAADEASAAGLHWTFAPMVDITRDPRWGRIMEGAGEDPFLASVVAAQRVKGFQGTASFDVPNHILACVKHFAAYGAPFGGRDYNTVDMSERMFREVYLPPYQAAIEAGARTVMTAFNELNGVPATSNKWLLTDLLRHELRFKGMVVTDYTSINELVEHGVAADEKHASELAVMAGSDMDMQSAAYHRFLKGLVEEGKVPIERVDEAARRVLRLKFELGLFEDPYRFCDEQREKEVILSDRNRSIARDVARKSIVLLRNEGVLPLPKETKKLAVLGPLAADKDNLIGFWSAAGEGRHCVSLLEGIRNKLGNGVELLTAKGCEITGDDKSGFAQAVEMARQADAVVVAIGESREMSGEAASKVDISLPGVQEDLVKALMETGKPLVVVLMNGRTLTIPWLGENAPALLETWWLGTEAGNAIADVLFGDYNPSGKLPVSFPRHVGQIPVFYSHKPTGRPYQPNDKWRSQYLDESNDPLFPFGYGLSYTTFEIGSPKPDKTSFRSGEVVKVQVKVTNTGNREGEEVVQLYIRDKVASVTRPVKELKAFKKVSLKPGESKDLRFTLFEKDFAFLDQNLEWTIEPGEFEIKVGNSSDNVKAVVVERVE